MLDRALEQGLIKLAPRCAVLFHPEINPGHVQMLLHRILRRAARASVGFRVGQIEGQIILTGGTPWGVTEHLGLHFGIERQVCIIRAGSNHLKIRRTGSRMVQIQIQELVAATENRRGNLEQGFVRQHLLPHDRTTFPG